MNKILNTLKLLRKPISTAERAGVPKVIRNQRIKPNPNAGDFSHQLPTQREIPSFFSDDKWTLEDINYLAPKSLIDDVNRILRGEIVVPYKKGGKFK